MPFRSAGSTSNTGPLGPVAVLAAVLLLCLSPLMRGGNRQVALIVLEAVGSLILLAVLIRRVIGRGESVLCGHETLPRKILLWVLVLSPAWLAIAYLTPIPKSLWVTLPGRAIYDQLLSGAAIRTGGAMPLSLVPDATMASLLAGIPMVAGFMAAYAARPPQLKLLLVVAAGMAFLQVMFGFLQAAGGHASSLYFAVEFGGRPLGTFANTNHFANYIGMAAAGYVWLGWNNVVARREAGTDSEMRFGERHALAFWVAGGLVLLLGILMTFSRGAALSGLPAALLAVCVAYLGGGRSQNWRTPLLLTALLLVGAILLVGAGALLSRFELTRLAADASFRTLLASSTLAGAREFWPWGAGWGTFASAYPRFQPIAIDGYAEHAHQDYAQMLFEGGIFTVLLAGVFLSLATGRAALLIRAMIAKGMLGSEELASAICGVGLLGFLVHSLVEFNMHIPANAILAALLAGAYLRPLGARHQSSL